MKYFFLSYILTAVIVVSFAGFRGHRFSDPPLFIFPDMKDQAKVKYQQASNFFDDGHANHAPVTGTVPMGFAVPHKPASAGFEAEEHEFTHGGGYYFTGKIGDYFGDGFPKEVKVDAAFIKRGQDRFNIHCAICHGPAGNGKGVFTKFTTVLPADFTSAGFDDPKPGNALYRPDGKIYDVITHGYNQMGSYGANLDVQDRWAVVAYIRTLQFAAKNPAPAK